MLVGNTVKNPEEVEILFFWYMTLILFHPLQAESPSIFLDKSPSTFLDKSERGRNIEGDSARRVPIQEPWRPF